MIIFLSGLLFFIIGLSFLSLCKVSKKSDILAENLFEQYKEKKHKQ